jgi:hypothetical protein
MVEAVLDQRMKLVSRGGELACDCAEVEGEWVGLPRLSPGEVGAEDDILCGEGLKAERGRRSSMSVSPRGPVGGVDGVVMATTLGDT